MILFTTGMAQFRAIADITLQADGQIIVAGEGYWGYNAGFAIARYHANGTLDTTFNGTGLALVDLGEGVDQAVVGPQVQLHDLRPPARAEQRAPRSLDAFMVRPTRSG